MKNFLICPQCGHKVLQYRNPTPTVDIIIEIQGMSRLPSIVLIERKNFPFGWALPGGFIDYGETAENAAVREAFEETTLKVKLKRLLGVFSAPDRDPRGHTLSVVFIAEAEGNPVAQDDALRAQLFSLDECPDEMAFDHAHILETYRKSL